MRMRELWGPRSAWLTRHNRNVFCDGHSQVEIQSVPDSYLTGKVQEWLKSSKPSLL
jgi:hypothetical protein